MSVLVRHYDIKTDHYVWAPPHLIGALEGAQEAWIQSGGIPVSGGSKTGDPALYAAVVEAQHQLEAAYVREDAA